MLKRLAEDAFRGASVSAPIVAGASASATVVAGSDQAQRNTSPSPRVLSPCQTSSPFGFRSARPGGLQLTTGASQPRPQSVLLFGDSLTYGTVGGPNGTGPAHPYGKRLEELLGTSPGAVSISGWAGELAMDMGRRLQKELAQRRAAPPSHVVLLAGTNDIRAGKSPEAVLQQLKMLHSMIRATGAKCVAVTIPQCGPWDRTTVPLAKPRALVNDGLRAAALAGAQGRGPALWLADFDAVLVRLPTADRNALFSDSCHFTPSGYDMLGDLVHAAIQSSLPKLAASPASLTESKVAGHVPAVQDLKVPKPGERLAVPNAGRAAYPGVMVTSRSAADLLVARRVIRVQPYVHKYVACR